MTPSEVSTAARLGLHVCKLFPATVLGASWLRAMKGPFPTMNFIAVGGITAANADEFIKAGATGVAFGSSIEYLLTENDLSTFITNVHQLADNGVYS
jgi:2-keto-3-deoxy-6-phosphogluconate aldolase